MEKYSLQIGVKNYMLESVYKQKQNLEVCLDFLSRVGTTVVKYLHTKIKIWAIFLSFDVIYLVFVGDTSARLT